MEDEGYRDVVRSRYAVKWVLIWAMFARRSECTGCTAIPRELTCARVRMRACVEFLHIRGTSGTSLSYLSLLC